jgi:hypothetical protein
MLIRACKVMLLAGASFNAHSQWLNYPTPGTPRTRDGKPHLTAPAPRAANGKPDLSGVWQVESTPAKELKRLFGDLSVENVLGDSSAAYSKYLVDILVDFEPGETLLRPEYADIVRQRAKEVYPLTSCLPIGAPCDDLLPGPFKMIQTPGLTLVRNEYENTFRQIYTMGVKVPPIPSRYGWDIPLASGKAKRLWSRRWGSTIKAGWMGWVTRVAKPYTYWNVSTGVISAIWTSRLRSTIRKFTPNHSP